MKRNLSTRLQRRSRANPMAAHDRLPPRARAWVAQAALPWSAASVARIWHRALRETGCEEAALDRLRAAEERMLARDRLPVAGAIASADSAAAQPKASGACQ